MARGDRKENGELDLDGFQDTPEDQGLSLDALSGSLASLLDKGNDPYETVDEETPQEEVVVSPTDEADDRSCPVSPRSILEAMLFVGHPDDEPLTSKQVASLMRGVRPAEVDQLIEELNESYEEEGCPYYIEAVAAGYRLTLREEFVPIRERFYGKVREAKLSQAAIDVLAIVAYHQPAERSLVDQLRREESGRLLAQLVRRELLSLELTDEKPRRKLYRTTDRFLDLIGIESLAELPVSQDFDRR